MSGAIGEPSSGLERASALCDLRRYGEAEALLSRVVATDPDNPYAWCLIAQARLGLDRHREALRAAETAIPLAPDWEWPHRLASIALQGLGNYVQAARAAKETVRLGPDLWQTHVRLAHASIRAWRLDEARNGSDRALALAPDEPDVRVAAGAVAAAAGHPNEAEAHFRRALEIEPDNAAAHNELARLQLKNAHMANPARLAQAATGFATALRSDPRTSVSRRNLDLVLRTFLVRVAYVVFVGAYAVVRLGPFIGSRVGRIVMLVVLAALCAFVWAFVGRLTSDLRRYLVRLLLSRRMRFTVGFDLLAIGCLVAGVALSSALRPGLAVSAVALAVAARVLVSRSKLS